VDKVGKEQEAIELRRYAEKELAEHLPVPPRGKIDEKRLLHELQVHQIELEVQNEQLRQTQAELESALTRFTDLYDFAPVGYLTLTAAGFVDESNYTVASMLGVEWPKLLRFRFDPFISQEDIGRWYKFFADMLQEADGQRKNIKLTLRNSNGQIFPAQINCVHFKTKESASKLRIAITEINLIG